MITSGRTRTEARSDLSAALAATDATRVAAHRHGKRWCRMMRQLSVRHAGDEDARNGTGPDGL